MREVFSLSSSTSTPVTVTASTSIPMSTSSFIISYIASGGVAFDPDDGVLTLPYSIYMIQARFGQISSTGGFGIFCDGINFDILPDSDIATWFAENIPLIKTIIFQGAVNNVLQIIAGDYNPLIFTPDNFTLKIYSMDAERRRVTG